VVNVYGNNTMHSGTVTDAYLLEGDYGGGAWLREAVGTERTILPFECFIRASETSTALYQTLQRGMMIVDTPTGIGSVAGNPSSDTRKVIIDNQMYILRGENMYTIQGVLVK
jgi:hypothetical protein